MENFSFLMAFVDYVAGNVGGSRSRFLEEVINPLIESGKIYRDCSSKSPTVVLRIKN